MGYRSERRFSLLEHAGAAYAAIVFSIVGINIAEKPVERPEAVSGRVTEPEPFNDPVTSIRREGVAMSRLELDDREQETLAMVLESYLSELHTEIGHTDRQALREELRGQERLIKQIQERLAHATV